MLQHIQVFCIHYLVTFLNAAITKFYLQCSMLTVPLWLIGTLHSSLAFWFCIFDGVRHGSNLSFVPHQNVLTEYTKTPRTLPWCWTGAILCTFHLDSASQGGSSVSFHPLQLGHILKRGGGGISKRTMAFVWIHLIRMEKVTRSCNLNMQGTIRAPWTIPGPAALLSWGRGPGGFKALVSVSS